MRTDTKSHPVRALLWPRSSVFLLNRWQMTVLSAVVFGMSLAVADAETKKKMFSIEAQPARHSLTLYARQAQVQLGFAADVTDDIVTNSVIGEYDVSQALELLLEGTGLRAEHGERGIVIRPVQKAEGAGSIDEPATADAETTSLKLVKNLTLPSAQATQQSTPAVAGQTGENQRSQPTQEIDNIIVTGTSIRGVTNPASPVITFTREDIERSGLATLPEFIQIIPQNFSGGFTAVSGSVPGAEPPGGNTTQGTGLNLRGLGSEATLTLLNGRRLAPAGLGNFTDISTIPASAVERIEVVLDGASAIYGADAVGGVINIILRDDFDGAETAVRYETVTNGGRDAWRASQALGTSWDTGNVFASYEFVSQAPLRSTERGFAGTSLDPYDISPDNENHSVVAAFSQSLGDNASLFATANHSTRATFTNIADLFGPLTSDIAVDQYGGVLGAELSLPGSWLAEASTSYNRYESDATIVFTAFDFTTNSTLATEVWSWDLRADGELFALPGGNAKLAVGAGTRNEKLETQLDLDRDIRYIFAETLVPLVQPENAVPGIRTLEVSAAVRYEDYDDFDTSTDGKIGIVWSPSNGVQIRGTFGTSFRAPLLIESAAAPNSILAVDVPDPQSPTGTSPGLYLQGNAISNLAPELGTPLEPEESDMFTISVDFTPDFWPGFTASVSYFDIEFDNRIEAPPFTFDVLQDPAFSSLVTRNPTADQIEDALAVIDNLFNLTGLTDDELLNGGAAFIYDQRTANIAGTTNKGFDVQLGYTRELREGQIGFRLSGTYLTDLVDQFSPTAVPLDRLNTFQNPIDLRIRAGVFWSTDQFNTSLYANYADSYRDNQQTPEAKISSFTTFDWTITYELGGANTPSLLRNVNLLFGAVNLLDEDPPFVDGASSTFGVNFDARNASPFGRMVSLQITKNWLSSDQ